MSSQWSRGGGSDERVYFQVHGLPQVLKLKIAFDSPLHHLFDHIPAKKFQPPLCIDGPEFVWRDIVLDPFKTPEDYRMESGERNVQTIVVNYPLVSPRTALQVQRSLGDDSVDNDTPRRTGGANAVQPSSARLSIDGDNRRSPFPSARGGALDATSPNSQQQQSALPPMSKSPRMPYQVNTPAIPSVDKIIDDLTQALRGAEDEIEDLQERLAQKSQQVESLKPEKVAALEEENVRLKNELAAERKENDSKQEAIQILRNKISVLESAASRAQENSQNPMSSSSPSPSVASVGANAATEALASSLRHHCHSLEEELSNREEEIRQLNARIEKIVKDAAAEHAEKEQEIKKHKESLERLDATRMAMSKKDETALNSAEELRVRIDRLERENAIMQADNTTLAQRVVAAETHKNELRGLKNQYEIETAAWNAQRSAFEKEIKALREKCAEHLLNSQRHEKVLSERNAALQEKIAFFEDPRSVNQREEEYQQRELEMRSRLRDTLAENDRLKNLHKDAKRQVSELETALFECNNVLVRVQKENSDLKKNGFASLNSTQNTPRVDAGRLPASARTMSANPIQVGSPLATTPQPASVSLAASKAADSALLHVDPFSLVRGSTGFGERSNSSPNVADAILLSRHTAGAPAPTQPAASDIRIPSSSFQEA